MMATTHNERDSRLELLRLIVMFMILMIHASSKAFNQYADISLPRAVVVDFSICAVNVFVLITGYFGASFRFKKLFNLLFQVAFVIALTFMLLSLPQFGSDFVINKRIFVYWFIYAYIGLLVVSPLLNNLNFGRKTLLVFILIFYIITSFFDLFVECYSFRHGYSFTWFIVVYLIGVYIRQYRPNVSKLGLIGIFLLALSLNVCLTAFVPKAAFYSNPFVVVESISLFMFFLKLEPFHNKIVNYLAASATMIYLVNDSLVGEKIYVDTINRLFQSETTTSFILYTTALMLCYYIAGILIDQLRKVAWWGVWKISGKGITKWDAMLERMGL